MKPENDLTVIVPTRNEAHNIEKFIMSLPENIPLIAVDASQDNTREKILKLRKDHTLVVKYGGNIPEARQLGASYAKTPWLLFTDADIHFDPDYFQNLPKYADYDLVYGPKLSQDRYQGYYQKIFKGQQFLQSLNIPAVSGSNLLILSECLSAVGGFDPQLSVNEDTELGYRVKSSGYQIKIAPDLVVYSHDHRRLINGTWRKTFHSITRCSLLYFNLMPDKWRSRDWGYWSLRNVKGD